jgi:small conductance mechanosensitive channel
MENIWPKVSELIITYGPAVLKALATLVIGWIVVTIITGVVRRLMVKSKVDPTLSGFVGKLTYIILMTLVVISAIQMLGVATTSFIAVIGAAGLAIGFALQGSLANFAAGTMLIIFRPFKIGDYVEAGGVGGIVEELEVFVTTLRTPDNKKVIVPNAIISGGTITNYSANPTRRIDLVFGISYDDDLKKAKKILEDILAKDDRILKEPVAIIAVAELADSSVNFVVRPWVKTADYWDVHFDLTEAVKVEFDAQGISIPFPQQDVHMHQVA